MAMHCGTTRIEATERSAAPPDSPNLGSGFGVGRRSVGLHMYAQSGAIESCKCFLQSHPYASLAQDCSLSCPSALYRVARAMWPPAETGRVVLGRWQKLVRLTLCVLLRIRRRDPIFSLAEEIQMRRMFDAETSSASGGE